jgi:tetratricopeptide (TPR) repeat protein
LAGLRILSPSQVIAYNKDKSSLKSIRRTAMPAKKKPEKDNNNQKPEANDPQKLFPRMERDFEKIVKSAKDQHFKNIDQAKEYIDKLMDPSKPLPDLEPLTALEKAQELAWDAMEAPTRKAAISLAREALKISPDCADAYVILAEEYAKTAQEAIYYYKAGVAAGERAIGPEEFKKLKGAFWGVLETRPYMRARVGLAVSLWETGESAEAIDHLQEMIKLNPDDNQGIRYLLAAWLFESGDMAALKKLLAKYNDGTAAWIFTKALLVFKEKGETAEAQKAIEKAVSYNPHVVAYLTGRKKLPGQLPDYVGYGDKNEAVSYVSDFGMGWLKTPGALKWLNKLYPEKPKTSAAAPKVKGIPEAFIKAFEPEEIQKTPKEKTNRIFTLKVGLKYSPGVWRKIEIKGSQTLHHLHKEIVKAFERDDDHLYAFFMNNVAWDDRYEFGPPYGENEAGNSTRAKIDSLDLQAKSKFLYIFDFGDCWEHPVTVLSVREENAGGKYPRIVESKGEAPPQYPYDEEE